MREWRPFSAPDASKHAKPAASLNSVVPAVMKGLGLEQRLQQSQVFFLWPNIVGADIARHAQPVALRGNLLIVAVDHPVWLQELSRYHKPLILQKVQKTVGTKAVRDISFRIG